MQILTQKVWGGLRLCISNTTPHPWKDADAAGGWTTLGVGSLSQGSATLSCKLYTFSFTV